MQGAFLYELDSHQGKTVPSKVMKVRRLRQQLRWALLFITMTSLSLTITFFTVLKTYSGAASHWRSLDFGDMEHAARSSNLAWIILEAHEVKDVVLSVLNNTGWNFVVIGTDDGQSAYRCSQSSLCLRLRNYHTERKHSLESLAAPMTKDGGDSGTLATAVFKMAAILFAMTSGAKWIYIGRPENLALSRISQATLGEKRTGLVYGRPGRFNLLRDHFGNLSGDVTPRVGRYNLKVVQPLGVMTLVDQCTRQYTCSSANPPIYIMPGTMASLPSSFSMLSHRDSFWMLLVALYPSNHASRALVGAFLQRLLWETNQSLSIASSGSVEDEVASFCRRRRCPSNNLHATMSYLRNLKRAHVCSPVVSYNERTKSHHHLRLARLKCPWADSSFTKCMHELMVSAFTYRQGDDADLRVMSGWFRLLQEVGYHFPKRDPLTEWKMVAHQRGVPIWFTPAPCAPKDRAVDRGSGDEEKDEKEEERDLRNKEDKHVEKKTDWYPSRLTKECQYVNVSIGPEMPTSFQIPDILLIIVFNFPYLASQVPLLLTMYGRHFRHILFCGENFATFGKFYKMDRYPHVSFVEINHAQGTWGYSCMSAAVKMNYDVTGYLQMSDDVLLNVWNLKNAPRDQFWYQSRVRVADIRLARLPDIATTNRWYPWIFAVGRYAAIVAYRTLRQLMRRDKYRKRIEAFLSQLHQTTQCKACLTYEASDIFYVPKKLRTDFALFADVFQASQLHLEIAIPSAIFGLSKESKVFRLRGNYVWGDDRAEFKKYYSNYDHFQHAWKLTRLANREGMEFFCRHYLPWLEKDLKASELAGGKSNSNRNSNSNNNIPS